MKRRDFIKLAGAAGLALTAPVPSLRAQELPGEAGYTGNFYVFLGCNGGFDPTFFCDPKGYLSEEDLNTNPMHRFPNSEIDYHGNIPFAPVGYYPTFVERFYDRMLLINGIDTQTNGHDSGRRHVGSGKLAEGFPCFGALVAAHYGRGLPMSFVTNGFYDVTAGTVARTRVGNVRAFERIARPNHIDAGNLNSRLYHTEETMDRILDMQRSRIEALRGEKKLPAVQRSLGTLHLARDGDNVLQRLLEYLPDNQPQDRLMRQAQLAIAAYRAGACVSANLNTGGFDTHGNHDASHLPRLDTAFRGAEYLLDEAERQGIADKMVLVIGSDFGRTPGYNANNGKDHWSATSMIFIGPGIPGNKVIGETTHRHGLKRVDPDTLQVVENGGIRMHPGHVHWALRRHAGIDRTELHTRFPFDVDRPLEIFAS